MTSRGQRKLLLALWTVLGTCGRIQSYRLLAPRRRHDFGWGQHLGVVDVILDFGDIRHIGYVRDIRDVLLNDGVLLDEGAWRARGMTGVAGDHEIHLNIQPARIIPVFPPLINNDRIVAAPAIHDAAFEPKPAIGRPVVIAEIVMAVGGSHEQRVEHNGIADGVGRRRSEGRRQKAEVLRQGDDRCAWRSISAFCPLPSALSSATCFRGRACCN